MIYIINKPTRDSKYYLFKILKEDYNYLNQDLIYNEYHKPYLKDNKYYFSISHTKDILVIIVDNREVGIDIEYLRPFNEGVARKLFTIKEIDLSKDNETLFTEIFTKKESYGKYLGTGLGEYLKEIEVYNNQLIQTINYNEYIISVTNAQIIDIKTIN